nr:hypothetical transcript [Hymenolepis microstoma]
MALATPEWENPAVEINDVPRDFVKKTPELVRWRQTKVETFKNVECVFSCNLKQTGGKQLVNGCEKLCDACKDMICTRIKDCKRFVRKEKVDFPVEECSGWRMETWTLDSDCNKKMKHKMRKKKRKNKSKKKDCSNTTTTTAIPKSSVENICCPYVRCGCICATSDCPPLGKRVVYRVKL